MLTAGMNPEVDTCTVVDATAERPSQLVSCSEKVYVTPLRNRLLGMITRREVVLYVDCRKFAIAEVLSTGALTLHNTRAQLRPA